MNKLSTLIFLGCAQVALISCAARDQQVRTDTASGSISGSVTATSDSVKVAGASRVGGDSVSRVADSARVAEVTLGKAIGTDKRITTPATTFATGDTIHASVHTMGKAPNTLVSVRWMFEDGSIVREENETSPSPADSYSAFHISKSTPWANGRYKIVVLLNGREAHTTEFTIR